MRDQLRLGPLTQREQFKYAVAVALFAYVNAESPFIGPSGWNLLVGLGLLLFNGVAIYYVYLCNGGNNGERFLERYLSIGWILMVRIFVLATLPLLTLWALYTSTSSSDQGIHFSLRVAATVVMQLLFYWLLGRQFRAISRPAI